MGELLFVDHFVGALSCDLLESGSDLELAIGSERYVPYDKPVRPQELLTQANAILGQGQLSLAKYLMILNDADHPVQKSFLNQK